MNELARFHDGVRCTKNNEGNLTIELDHDGAWWIAMALQSDCPEDAATRKIMDFVCDHFEVGTHE